MATRIAYRDAEGYTCIILPAYNDGGRDWSKTDEDIIGDCVNTLPPGTEYILIDDDNPDVKAILLQRDKRDDWIITDDGLAIKR